MKRQIIKIDEDKCTGCGECVPSCAENALQVVDGKVRVVADVLCDGLGACLGECPEGALTIEEREAPEFDEAAVEARRTGVSGCADVAVAAADTLREQQRQHASPADDDSLLRQWPVQLSLVNPSAPQFRDSDLLAVADCVPVAYRRFQEEFLPGHTIVMTCPKLDQRDPQLDKLVALFREARPRSVSVVHMEVPCCFGLVGLVRQAIDFAGIDVPFREVVITVAGNTRE